MSETKDRFILRVPEDMNDIFPGFLQNRREEITALPAALERGDFHQIRVWGHNMAGCGEGYGFPAISEVGRLLEAAALAKDLEGINHHTAELNHLVNDVEVVYCDNPTE